VLDSSSAHRSDEDWQKALLYHNVLAYVRKSTFSKVTHQHSMAQVSATTANATATYHWVNSRRIKCSGMLYSHIRRSEATVKVMKLCPPRQKRVAWTFIPPSSRESSLPKMLSRSSFVEQWPKTEVCIWATSWKHPNTYSLDSSLPWLACKHQRCVLMACDPGPYLSPLFVSVQRSGHEVPQCFDVGSHLQRVEVEANNCSPP